MGSSYEVLACFDSAEAMRYIGALDAGCEGDRFSWSIRL
jgi:hypothetical protein